jgi:hypothetical protein
MTEETHHQRRRHIRGQADGTVTPVRETAVKNRGRTTTQSPRNPSRRDALTNLATEDDDFETDMIVFAFEHPEWSSKGFRRADAQPWMNLGIDPDNASMWRDAGYNAEYANKWRTGLGTRIMPADDALTFIEHNVPIDAAILFTSTTIPTEEALRWHYSGIPAFDAITWRSKKHTPEKAQEYIALGLTEPSDLRHIDSLGQKMAHRWYQEGVSLATASMYQILFDEGHSVKRIAAVIKSDHTGTLDDRYDWIESTIPDNQIAEFAEKGYRTHRAEQLYAKGQTSSTVPDLFGGELVPGKSWPDIKKAFDTAAMQGDYDVQMHAEDRSIFRQVEVTLTNKNNPTDTRIYHLRFSHSGAFEQASSNVKRKTRVVKTKAEFLRLHFPDTTK